MILSPMDYQDILEVVRAGDPTALAVERGITPFNMGKVLAILEGKLVQTIQEEQKIELKGMVDKELVAREEKKMMDKED